MSLLLLAAVLAGSGKAPTGPVTFTADQMTMEPRARQVLLEGTVHLKRGDLTVTGDRAVAELAPEGPSASRKGASAARKRVQPSVTGVQGEELRRFTVDGHVHVERQGRTADGDHAEFDSAAQTLLLTGVNDALPQPAGVAPGPVLRDGAESLTGERILLHLEGDDVDVARPRLVLHRSADPADARKPAQQARPAVPVRVEAARLALDSGGRIARFREDVVVHRGDATVRGSRMDARYDKAGELTTLDMRGGVVLVEGDRRATGRNAVYDAVARTVVLTGDPRLYDRGDVLLGERIEVALDSHEVKVAHARGHLHPERHQGEEGAP